MNKLRLGIFPNMKKENVKNSLPKVLDLCDKAEIEAVLPQRLDYQDRPRLRRLRQGKPEADAYGGIFRRRWYAAADDEIFGAAENPCIWCQFWEIRLFSGNRTQRTAGSLIQADGRRICAGRSAVSCRPVFGVTVRF